MKIFQHDFGGNKVSAPESWIETTEMSESEDTPFTLAKKDTGVGALQFSTALYSGGEEPNIDIARLEEMLVEFANSKDLGEGFDERVYENRVGVVAASYHVGNDLIEEGKTSAAGKVAATSCMPEPERYAERKWLLTTSPGRAALDF